MAPGPRFLHVDMDAFYASVEVLDDPSLAGLPLIVGGDGSRGVVASCSYEARRFGVRSAMPSTEARRRCPQAVFRPGRFARYSELSARLHEIFADYTPLVEGVALDEAFLDVSGAARLLGPAEELAHAIRRRVADELGLACSVGVAGTMFVAKLASKAAKPRATAAGVRPGPAVVVVRPGEELEFLHPLPIEALWGVGPKTAARLRQVGIATIGQLAAVPVEAIETALGQAHGRHLHELSHGIDPRQVQPERAAKSVGHEETYARDLFDQAEVAREVLRLADAVAARLRAATVVGRTVVLKLRYGDFTTITRSRTLDAPTDLARDIARAANEALATVEVWPGVRLLGVSLTNLSETALASGASRGEQLCLPLELDPGTPAAAAPPVASWGAAADAVAEVRVRFGDAAVGPAALLGAGGLRLRRRGDAQWGPADPRPDETEAGRSER